MDTHKKIDIKKRVTFSSECGPARPEYKELAARLRTFEKRSWPPSLPQTPQKLAEAGFYYPGKKSEFIETGFCSLCISGFNQPFILITSNLIHRV